MSQQQTSDNQASPTKPGDIFTSDEIKELRQCSNVWGAYLLIHCWAVIALAIALYAFYPNTFTLILGITLVGGRQLGLAILMHEGSHSLLFKSRRLNDTLSSVFAAWPVVINLDVYRVRHMAHHRFTRSDKDPEDYLYTPFPVTKTSMMRKFLRDLTGIVFIRTNMGIFRYLWGDRKGRSTRLIGYYGGPVLFNALMAYGFAAFGRIDLWLLLWLLPYATTYQLFLRIRNIAEHATVPDLENTLKNSRTTLANMLERATVAPYWVNYHIEHHVLPSVPCYRLPLMHKLMIERGYGDHMEIREGYTDIIRLNASA